MTTGSTSESSLHYKLTRAMESYAVKHTDAVTTICNGLREDIVDRGVPDSKATLIPNAVDIENFQADIPRDEALAQSLDLNGKTVLGFLGSFYAYEGLDLVVRALPGILQENPDTVLLLVGGGPMEESLKAIAETCGVADRVIFTGRVPQAEVSRYYSLVDLLIYARHPTRLTDLVTPLKPLEAMAQKRLFLASDVDGHHELIHDNETGFLFRAGDLTDLTRKVNETLKAKSLWPKVLEQGRRFVETERNWTKSVSGYKQVYEQLAAAAPEPVS